MKWRRDASTAVDRPLAGWPTLRTFVALCAAVALIALAAVLVHNDPPDGSHRVGSSRPRALQLDACAYFTLDDARTLFGPDAVSPGPGPLGGCAYASEPDPVWPRPKQVVVVLFEGRPASPDAMYEGSGSIRQREAKGIGQSGRWYLYGKNRFVMLDVRYGRYVVRTWVGDAGGHSSGSNRAIALAATRLTMANLPAS